MTLRTPAALDALRAMVEACPEAMVGAGTGSEVPALRAGDCDRITELAHAATTLASTRS